MGHPASSRQGAPLGEGFFPHFVGGIHHLKSLLFSPYPAIPPYVARTPHPGMTDDHENSCAQRLPESGAHICSHGTLLMGGAHPQPKTYQFTSRASSEDSANPEGGREQAKTLLMGGPHPEPKSYQLSLCGGMLGARVFMVVRHSRMMCPHDIGRDSWVWGEQETLYMMSSPHKVGEEALSERSSLSGGSGVAHG